jgi:cob(I)alamin adenosyltransferase
MADPDCPAGTARLESEIDAMTKDLRPLKKFIMPGGSAAGAGLHLARAVCRRAERAATALAASEPVPADVLVYLNRLSDHLFTAARWANARLGAAETPWEGLARR